MPAGIFAIGEVLVREGSAAFHFGLLSEKIFTSRDPAPDGWILSAGRKGEPSEQQQILCS
jgi:hypothetical protein